MNGSFPVRPVNDTRSSELLTVVVPCCNEEQSVGPTVESILAERDRLEVRLEVLLVDDGSTDGTRAVMERLSREHRECRIKVNPTNLGVGRAVLDAYEEIDRDSWVTVVPGDNEIVFASIHGYLELRDHYDVILGYFRNAVIRTATRRLASQAFMFTVRLLYGFTYRYLNGMKMYRAWVFQGLDIRSGGHAFNAELLAKAVLRNPELRIGEVPFLARGRARGSSKAFRVGSVLRALRDVVVGVRSVARYRREVIERGGS